MILPFTIFQSIYMFLNLLSTTKEFILFEHINYYNNQQYEKLYNELPDELKIDKKLPTKYGKRTLAILKTYYLLSNLLPILCGEMSATLLCHEKNKTYSLFYKVIDNGKYKFNKKFVINKKEKNLKVINSGMNYILIKLNKINDNNTNFTLVLLNEGFF
jgi:hypothetical protein